MQATVSSAGFVVKFFVVEVEAQRSNYLAPASLTNRLMYTCCRSTVSQAANAVFIKIQKHTSD